MKTLMNRPITIVALAISSILMFSCNSPDGERNTGGDNRPSVYSRVLSSGKIRAAYTIYPPGCMKDSLGNLRGVFIETLEKAAEALDLKVEWTEEVGWATQIEGLNTDRYDMIGSSVWANPKRAKQATLTVPLYFSPIHVYVRSTDNRFNNVKSWSMLNNADLKIATIDGGTGEVIAKNSFPLAERVGLPQLTDFSQSFLDVVHRKADIVFMEPFHASRFLVSNPRTIKSVSDKSPLRVFGNCYMFKRDQPEFEHMLNTVLQDLMYSGYVEMLINKYEEYPNSYYRVANPYQLPTK